MGDFFKTSVITNANAMSPRTCLFLFPVSLISSHIFFPGSAFGQHESVKDADSLIQKLSNAETDTARILLKCQIGEAYRATNKPDTSFFTAKATGAGYCRIELGVMIL
jgi:hypothetical protein